LSTSLPHYFNFLLYHSPPAPSHSSSSTLSLEAATQVSLSMARESSFSICPFHFGFHSLICIATGSLLIAYTAIHLIHVRPKDTNNLPNALPHKHLQAPCNSVCNLQCSAPI
jgi:hypothetical protein